MKHTPNDLVEGSISKGLFLFALPLLGSSMIQQLYNTVDLMFVGNILGKEAAAAVGCTSLLTICIIGFFSGLGVGVGVITSQFFGASRFNGVQKTISTGAGLTILLSIATVLFGWFFSPALLRLMNTPEAIMALSVTYIRIYFLGVFSIVSYNMSAGVLRALGNSRSPMIYQLIGGVINIFANAFFMMVLKLGIAGAAYATILSQSVAAFLTIAHLCRLPSEYRLNITNIRIDWFLTKRICMIAIPEAIRSTLITFANIIVQSQINTLGVESMAAYAAYCKVEGFLYLPQWAIGQANTTFVGQNFGAGKMKRMEQSTKIALGMGMGITMIISLLILSFPAQVFGWFSSDPNVVALSVKIGQTTFMFYFLYAIVEVLSGAIRGTGKSLPPMIVSLVNMCGVRLIVLHIVLQYVHTINGIAVVFPITWLTTALSIGIYYLTGKWKKPSFISADDTELKQIKNCE